MIIINFGIIFCTQIKNDFFQNQTKKMIKFEEKINLLESKINNFDSKNKNEEKLLIIQIFKQKNYPKYLMKILMRIFYKKSKNNKWSFVMLKINI